MRVKRGAAFLLFMVVACSMTLSMPSVAVAQVVDYENPNVPPDVVITTIWAKTGILPAYNITGQRCYDLLYASGRDMMFVSLLKGDAFPVYRKEDVDKVYGVKYLDKKDPLITTILGGPYTEDSRGNSYLIVDNSGSPEVYIWKP